MGLSSLFEPVSQLKESGQIFHCEWHHKSTINKKNRHHLCHTMSKLSNWSERKTTHIIYIKKSSHNIHTRGTLSKLSPLIPNYNLLSRHFNFFYVLLLLSFPNIYIISLQGRLSSVNKMEFPHEVSIPSYIIIIPFNNIKNIRLMEFSFIFLVSVYVTMLYIV